MAILQKRVDIFFPHCLNAKLCFCTHVERCMRIILTEIKGMNDNYVIGGVTLTYSRPNYWANSNRVMT